jgi:hypothetical protein
MPGQGLERFERVPVRPGKQVGTSERTGRPRDLLGHLALARTRHLDGIEVLGDLVVVSRPQLQPLDRVVYLLEELLRLRSAAPITDRSSVTTELR